MEFDFVSYRLHMHFQISEWLFGFSGKVNPESVEIDLSEIRDS